MNLGDLNLRGRGQKVRNDSLNPFQKKIKRSHDNASILIHRISCAIVPGSDEDESDTTNLSSHIMVLNLLIMIPGNTLPCTPYTIEPPDCHK